MAGQLRDFVARLATTWSDLFWILVGDQSGQSGQLIVLHRDVFGWWPGYPTTIKGPEWV